MGQVASCQFWGRNWWWKYDVYSRKDKKVLLPLPTFSLIIKLSPTNFPGCGISHLPTCKPHQHPILIDNFSSTTFALTSFFSALRHKRTMVLKLFRASLILPIGFIVRMDQFISWYGVSLFDIRYKFVSSLWCHFYESTQVIKLHKAIHIYTQMSACRKLLKFK